jgi:DNA-binding NarL/FixJ family response regulator
VAEREGQSVNELRVLIADDHEDLRGIVVALLSSDFQVVGAVGDGQQLVQAAIFLQPDVIISDVRMPAMDGLSAKKELRSKGIQCPFIFMTTTDLKDLAASEEETCIGYLHKLDLFNELKLAIHAVALGDSYISRSFRERSGRQ